MKAKVKATVRYGFKHGASFCEYFDSVLAASVRVEELKNDGWQDAVIKFDTTPNAERLMAALQAGRI